ncbi:MAG: alpha/beta hydrolase [Cyanobacteria bacterium P01_G01_bin.54]
MLGTLVSNLMIKPGQSPVFNNPIDFDLDYTDVEFTTQDGVTLRGWLINSSLDKIIIQTHFGVQCSRSGYTPKGKGLIKLWQEDISFLRQARYLKEQGYSVLMYDLRNHGNSELGICPWVSWGPEEAKDVIAAVDFITQHPDYTHAQIGLLSICMGAVASTYAYGLGNDGLRQYANIKAMIVVQPLHYTAFVQALGLPIFLNRAGNQMSRARLGFDLNEKTFMPDVSSITVPTLVLQNKNDPWTDLNFVQQYYDKLKVEKELFWLELSGDRAAAYNYLGTNPETLATFFDRYIH